MDQLRELMDAFIAEEQNLLSERTAAADTAATLVYSIVIIGGLIVALVAVMAAFLFRRQLAGRIDEAMRVATSIADGNLSTEVDDDGQDEIAELLSAMATMQTQLRGMMGEIKTASTELDTASQSVASTAEQLSASSNEQTKASDTIATSIQELSTSINHVSILEIQEKNMIQLSS